MTTQTALNVHTFGQTRSRAIVTDTIRQVSTIFSKGVDGEADITVQAGAHNLAGSLQIKGGYLDDLAGATEVPLALEVGVRAGSAPAVSASDALTAVSIKPLTVQLDDHQYTGQYTLRSADENGTLVWAPTDALPRGLTVAEGLEVGQALSVGGDVSVGGVLFVPSELSVGRAHVNEDLVLGQTLSVGGATTLGDTLSVGGATTLGDTLSVGGATTLDGTLSVGGATTLDDAFVVGDLSVGGQLTLDGTNANLTLANLRVTNNLTVNGSVTAVRSEEVIVKDRRIELGVVSAYAPVTLFRPQLILAGEDEPLYLLPQTSYEVNAGMPVDTPSRRTFSFVTMARRAAPVDTVVVNYLLVRSKSASLGAGGDAFPTGEQHDWVEAVFASSAVGGDEAARQHEAVTAATGFSIAGSAFDGTLRVACPTLFAAQSTNPYASALKEITVEEIVPVVTLHADGTLVYDRAAAGGDADRGLGYVYALKLVTNVTSETIDGASVDVLAATTTLTQEQVVGRSPVVVPPTGLADPTALSLGLTATATVAVDIVLYDDAARVGGGLALKGSTDAVFEFVRAQSQTAESLKPGFVPDDGTFAGPEQLQAWYSNHDVALGIKHTPFDALANPSRLITYHDDDGNVVESGGKSRRRSNVIHMGDLNSKHFMIVATWANDGTSKAERYEGDATEDDVPKLQFYYGRDLYDDRALDDQDGADHAHKTHLVFEISAPLPDAVGDSSGD